MQYKQLLKEKGLSTAVGDEGGFAPNLKNEEEVLEKNLEGYKEYKNKSKTLKIQHLRCRHFLLSLYNEIIRIF